MLIPVETHVPQVSLDDLPQLSSISTADVAGASDDERLAYTSEDGQSGHHTISEEEGESEEGVEVEFVPLIQIATAQTSTYDSSIMNRSRCRMQFKFPILKVGEYGDVYKCTLNRGSGPEEVAVKSLRVSDINQASCVAKTNRSIDREIEVWTKLDHQYVLHLYGTVTGFGPCRALVSPWMPNSTLRTYLDREHETLTVMRRLHILKQITEGLKYLHDNNVTHGDLTSGNILVAADGSPRLAGFDVSNIMVESNPTFPYQPGAVRWAAPELFVPQEVRCTTKSSDIYSLGCIMLEVYGATPYWWIGLIHGVIAAKFAYREPINNTLHIPAYYRDFMRQCWSIKYECRPVVEEVLDFLEEAICVRLGSELVFFFFFFIVTPSLYIQKHAGTYS